MKSGAMAPKHTLPTAKGEMHAIVAPSVNLVGGGAHARGDAKSHAHHKKSGHHPAGAKHMSHRGR